MLLSCSESEDRTHLKCSLSTHKTSKAAVSAFQFLHDQAVRDVVHIGAAIFLGQGAAEQAHFGHFRNQFGREGCFFEMLIDNRDDPLINKSAYRIAHHALFVAQQVVDSIKVDTLELHQPTSEFCSVVSFSVY